MNSSLCQLCDDFLNRGLSPEAQKAFAAHVPDCPVCRQVVDEHEHLAALLRQAVLQAEPIPIGLSARVEKYLGRTSRRRWLLRLTAGLAAAAVLAGAGLWWLVHPPGPVIPGPTPIVDPRPFPAPAQPDPGPLVNVSVYPQSPVITVREKTKSSNVTILWVYAAVPTAAWKDPNSNDSSEDLKRSEP